MTTEFKDLNLHPQLVQAVEERGYIIPTPIQAGMIPLMLTGADVLGQAQTGTGKTAAFALPILQNLQPGHPHIQSLVLAPTRELALQVAEFFEAYGQFRDVRVLAVYGGQAYGPQISHLRRGVDVVIGTPGRLIDLIERKVLDLNKVQTVVLDEADEMLKMGFIEDVETILAETPTTRQTALFSATLPAEIRCLSDKYMCDPQSITIQREQITVAAIEQRYYLVNHASKLAGLTRIFEVEEISSALIFARTRAGTGDLANELSVRGFPAEALNGDLSQEARERTLSRFRSGQVKVLVATDVAARGLDIDGISHVFNFDMPDDPDIYVHRIGRTGRAGKTGVAVSLVTPREKSRLRHIESFTHQKLKQASLPTDEDIRSFREEKLMTKVVTWLQRGRCKRERELAERLAEAGHDPLEIAAVALKLARVEDKQRPLIPIVDGIESSPLVRERYERPRMVRPDRFSETSHEIGMVRLNLSVGQKHGIRPNDIVGVIASHAGIPGHVIGKIFIQDKYSLVDVPEQYVRQVLAKSGGVHFRQQLMKVRLA